MGDDDETAFGIELVKARTDVVGLVLASKTVARKYDEIAYAKRKKPLHLPRKRIKNNAKSRVKVSHGQTRF